MADEGYEELPQFPGQGIPVPAGVTGTWLTPQQSVLSYLASARQWTRTPTLQAVAFKRDTVQLNDLTCRRITQAPGAMQYREYWADTVLVNGETAPNSSRRYGYTQSFVVRTVAFGSVPVEATVALEQPRDSRGVVIPTTVRQADVRYCEGQGDFEVPPPYGAKRYPPAAGAGRMDVRIDRLKVDGVTLPVAGCAADGATLTLTSRDYQEWTIPADEIMDQSIESIMRTKYYAVTGGGLLLGTLDVPAFAGCVTDDGEDISALLTASVSGEGNTVLIRTESLGEPNPDQFAVCPFVRTCPDRFSVPALPTAPPA
ncbi:hypothetical protein [Mumia sp. DW29H23]|uniref:hypothetical protein n=1 Tax=Mumia sp. DW29H23 TaxID=3421241 RepID=UPI003D68BC00